MEQLQLTNDEDTHCQEVNNIKHDCFNEWSDKSRDIHFKSNKKCIENCLKYI